ncbi:hypothetical protein D3C87_1518430 [compost metagenome]
MRDRRGELDHVIGLRHITEAFGSNKQATSGAVQNRIDQNRAQGSFANLIKNLPKPEAQKRFVLKSLNR